MRKGALGYGLVKITNICWALPLCQVQSQFSGKKEIRHQDLVKRIMYYTNHYNGMYSIEECKDYMGEWKEILTWVVQND